ncbi:metallophosphoesterase family protein [Clostridium tertium]|uniref:metallophosphoesterase family protein n=1 Tax=Clostridium tertium TaxID=1559 RepID=UPI00288BEE5D|nr:metallophosphoesterase [Clostridium tertium]
MKIKKFKLIITIITLVLLGVISTEFKPNTTTVEAKSNENLSFAVLGDVHENINHLQETINDLYTINPKMDALVLNGDAVDQGLDEQYNSMQNTLNKNKDLLPQVIIKNIGNHEFFDYKVESNSPEQVQSFISKYLEFSGEEKVYHDKWVKGYHFISLGSEDGNSETINSVTAFISDEQLEWFKEKLAENYKKGKPIFVFLHQHLDYGDNPWVGSKQSEEIKNILEQYPEVIMFSSHTHRDLNESSVVLNKPFTIVNTGAVHYTIIPDSNEEKGYRRETDYIKGVYVEVNGNNVIIKGRDIKEKQWIFSTEISN